MKIPLLFHQIWMWKNIFPKKFQGFQNTWKHLHPDWKLILWTDDNIWEIEWLRKEDLKLCKNYAEQSDYLRYIILEKYGWVYIDTDFECLKNICPLIENCDFFIAKDVKWVINNAIIGSQKNHYLLKKFIKNLHTRLEQTKEWSKYRSNERLWPAYIESFIRKSWLSANISIFPYQYFYPIHWGDFAYGKMLLKNPNLDQAYGIHHYDSHWISPWFMLLKKIVFILGCQKIFWKTIKLLNKTTKIMIHRKEN